MTVTKYDWCISDVVKATGIKYHYVRRALLSGELDGIVAERMIRTNEQCVEKWLKTLRVK